MVRGAWHEGHIMGGFLHPKCASCRGEERRSRKPPDHPHALANCNEPGCNMPHWWWRDDHPRRTVGGTMTDIRETENGRTYVNRVPPCGHSNGTHPSGCWYVAVCDAVAAERERIKKLVSEQCAAQDACGCFRRVVLGEKR